VNPIHFSCIIELRGAGESYAQIGESVGCSKRGAKYVFDKYKDEGTIQNNWNLLGRPKSYSDRSERHLFRYLWDHPYTHLRDINAIANLNVHVSTVSRIVENLGFDSKVVNKKKTLDDELKQRRLGHGNMLNGMLQTGVILFTLMKPSFL